MGEAYRAKDTRLDRDMAIKVLPSHLTSNSEFKQRFEREAKLISQLSHPNICTLHDIGNEEVLISSSQSCSKATPFHSA